VVAAAIVEAAEKLDLSYPEIDTAKQKELEVARAARSRARSSHTDGVRSHTLSFIQIELHKLMDGTCANRKICTPR
jgi:hypothetical protein